VSADIEANATPALALVMPMAGRGSRFARNGELLPKPLIRLSGRPFFWWAVQSVRRYAGIRELMFVVLEEHCREFGLDRRILELFPEANLLRLSDVTSGAAQTARLGVEALRSDGPIAINDCDHAFICPTLAEFAAQTASSAAGALLCFRSDSAAYSYAQLGPDGGVARTVEKQVVSPLAIAGCYLFADRERFVRAYDIYRATCPYDELFISGLYNTMIAAGARVLAFELLRHCSFGTPEELARADLRGLEPHLLLQGTSP
jgi:dTDP-glucose pyrophosphorylase